MNTIDDGVMDEVFTDGKGRLVEGIIDWYRKTFGPKLDEHLRQALLTGSSSGEVDINGVKMRVSFVMLPPEQSSSDKMAEYLVMHGDQWSAALDREIRLTRIRGRFDHD